MLVLSRTAGQSARIRTTGNGDIWVTMLKHGIDVTFNGGGFLVEFVKPSRDRGNLGGYDITDASGEVTVIRRLYPVPPYSTYRIGIDAPLEYDIKREELITDHEEGKS